MKYTSKKVLLTILFSVLICTPSVATELPDFGEHPDYVDVDNAAKCSGPLNLPDGNSFEALFMRSDGQLPTTVDSQNGGNYFMTMPEGYELSYSFLINDGNKEQRLEEGIVEPIYIESKNIESKSPLESTILTRNTRKGSRIMYDLPSGYEYHSENGRGLKIQKIIIITSLKTGEVLETINKPVYVEHLAYRRPDKDRRMEYINTYRVRHGDCLWSIAKQVYGIPENWILIYKENLNSLKNPDLIYTGMELVIP